VARHHRGAAMTTHHHDWGTLINRQRKSKIANYLSYKNHWLTIIKNESLANLFWYFPYIFFY
jgi:hypothetical protein